MKTNQMRWMGGIVLLLILVSLGWFLVPAHCVSIWMDYEFTDWISPISNRLHPGVRLYEPGFHTPMPPLSYLLLHWLHPGDAIWIQQSLLNFGFQAGTLMLIYVVFSKYFNVGLAFASVMAAIPIFFILGKTIMYDSMAQFLVVLNAAWCLATLIKINQPGRPASKSAIPLRLGVQGLLITLLLLAKQSTGMGVVLGTGLTLILFPDSKSPGARMANVFILAVFVVATFCLAGLAMCRFVSFPGMIHDVFLTGSEPKGGSGTVLVRLVLFSGQVALLAVLVGLLLWTISRFLIRNDSRPAALDWVASLFAPLGQPDNLPASTSLPLMLAAMFITLAGLLLVSVPVLVKTGLMEKFHFVVRVVHLPRLILSLALGAALCAAILPILSKKRRAQNETTHLPLPVLVIIFTGAAVFHSLSVQEFRWYYDNNPLIVAALLCFISPFVAFNRMAVRPAQKRLAPVLLWAAFPCIFIVWTLALPAAEAVADCTETWGEIRQLDGARLRPESAGMRLLARKVNETAGPNDGVLLLPEDPNVQEWFHGQRPALSCAIVFTDQYWNRYVEQDFKTLSENPPKIIIIGPHDFWRQFTRLWHQDVGCERLIDLVIHRLLPNDYELLYRQKIIRFEHPPDFMDVYVLRPKSPAATNPFDQHARH